MNRESWLEALGKQLEKEFFEPLGQILSKYRVSCAFPAGESRRKRLGECYSPLDSKDGTTEIMISPVVDDEMQVAHIMAHEMVHACVGNEAKHGPAFRKVALGIGLEGQMRSTTPSWSFEAKVRPMLDELGPYPHAALKFPEPTKRRNSGMLKVRCRDCEVDFRATPIMAEMMGICPMCGGRHLYTDDV